MKVTAQNILDHNITFNDKAHAKAQEMMLYAGRIHYNLCPQDVSPNRAKRVGRAMVYNAAWGLKKGLANGVDIAYFVPNRLLPRPLGRVHLPTSLGHLAGVTGVSAAAALLVGTHGPQTTCAQVAGVGIERKINNLLRQGLAGYAVTSLTEVANKQTAKGHTGLAAACMWGAALIATASSVARTGLFVFNSAVSASVGVLVAVVAGAAASVAQGLFADDTENVDFESVFG